MSELYITANVTTNIRKTLLATASALVLAGYGEQAHASDANRPTVWIEGGWHFESVTGESDPLVPPLDTEVRAMGFTPFATAQKALGRTYGAEGSISFQPNGSDWVFSVSARYGRVQTTRSILDQKDIVGSPMKKGGIQSPVVTFNPTYNAFDRLHAKNSEAHAIVDFQVGKDIGVGLFGRGTDSLVNFGVRYAQMNARSKGDSYGIPYVKFEQGTSITPYKYRHKYGVSPKIHRSAAYVARWDNFHGLGPSLSLKNTTGLLGTVDSGQLALDWGVNAALLFGRQKAKTSHHSTMYPPFNGPPVIYPSVTRTRSRMVTVPNVGGFAGLSYRFPNAKISAGYRGDFFFGAKDGGLETRNAVDVGFHGPYATISIGFGG